MKTILIIPMALMGMQIMAQTSTIGMTDDFKQDSKLATRQSGFEGFQTYSSGIVNGSQFFNPKWAKGTLVSVNNEKLGDNYVFLFDKVRQELFLKKKDSADVLLANKNEISFFTINTDRAHQFEPADKFGLNKKGDFVEVLINNDKGYTLLKLVTTEFVKADRTDMEKQQKGDIYDAFVDNTTYYVIYNHSAPQEISLKAWSIKKGLKFSKDKVSAYFDQQGNSELDETFLVGLVEYVNG